MISQELLQSFCGKDTKISRIIAYGDSFLATDGHIGIVTKDAERGTYISSYVASKFRETVDKIKNKERGQKIELPPKIESIVCGKCNGTGKDLKCDECDGYGTVRWESDRGNEYEDFCQHCDGRGKLNPMDSDSDCKKCGGKGGITKYPQIQIGCQLFGYELLAKALTLPSLLLYPQDEAHNPAYITFNGGYGLIMPQRKAEDY